MIVEVRCIRGICLDGIDGVLEQVMTILSSF